MQSRVTIELLAEHLLRPTSADERERALLAAVCSLGFDVAAELWRRFEPDAGAPARPHGWFATRSLGSAHALPPSPLARAALEGAIDCELSSNTAVVRAGAATPSLALVVAGCSANTQLADEAHALLLVFAIIESKTAGADELAAPLPARPTREDEPPSVD